MERSSGLLRDIIEQFSPHHIIPLHTSLFLNAMIEIHDRPTLFPLITAKVWLAVTDKHSDYLYGKKFCLLTGYFLFAVRASFLLSFSWVWGWVR